MTVKMRIRGWLRWMGGCSGAKVGRGGDEEDEEDEEVAAAAAEDRVIGGIEESSNVVYGKA